ncbi:MAG TPA: gamma-glutamylcyclotransferase family protein [Chitinophagaceae bacterium]|nr:gamma-glutamylcyclotransferase family protein [Chitinophagaceae bacterium]
MKEQLFSYGTLQKQNVQLELFGRLLPGARDILEHYRIVQIEIKDEKFLATGEDNYQNTLAWSADSNDIIEGMVFDISPAELLMADKYEPVNYKRIKVKLRSGREAWIYIADME